MNIDYIEPLSRGWARMKKALFQPFDLAKWFTVGFTAFLAALLDGGGGAGGNSRNYGKAKFDFDDFFNFPGYAWEWLNSHPVWFTLILFGIGFIFVLSIVLTWVSSRGKFMFLDNVVFDKAEVKKPWYEFRREGNSLFVWRFVFGFILFFVFIVSFVYSFILIREMYFEGSFSSQIATIIGMIFYFLFLIIISAYITLFLNDFVVPIMYKNRITTTQAWFKFFPLFNRHIGHFIVYGLFIFVLMILVVIAVVIFGFVTCCIGLLLLIIPYIGSVVFLPVSYTFRAFSVGFLEQFGEDFKIFPKEEAEDLVLE